MSDFETVTEEDKMSAARRRFLRLKHRKGARPGTRDYPRGWTPLATSADARGVVLWYLANAIEHLSDECFRKGGDIARRDARLSDAFQAAKRAVDYLAAKSVAPDTIKGWRALALVEARLGLRLGGARP